MVAYILKFILCSGFLYSFYKVFLERESMYKINRFYLLFSIGFSLVAPLYKMELPMTMEETNLSPELLAYLLANPQLLEQESGWNYGEILNLFYGIIGFGLFLRFVINILSISYRIKHDEKFEIDKITFVLDHKTDQPFSFLHYIFLPQENYEDIHPNLIQHEKAHCIQKHSWDIMFIELFQIIFWFNPFIFFYKKSIKLNHEFLADEYVLQNDVDVKTYQNQIIDCIATQSQNSVASHFNFILTKKRLLMMTKHTSKRKVHILLGAAFPFIFSAFVLFSQKSFAQEVENNAKKVEKVLEEKIENPIKNSDEVYSENITIHLDNNKNGIYFPQEIKDIPKGDIKNLTIDYKTEIGKVELHSGEIKEFKLENINKKKKTISITNADILNNLNEKEIKALIVGKDRNSIAVIKQNNDTIKFNVNYEFSEDSSNILKIDDLRNNEILTPAIKSKLKELNAKDIRIEPNTYNFEIIKNEGKKIFKLEDQVYIFGDNDNYIGKLKLKDSNKKPLTKEQIKSIEKDLKNIPPINNKLSFVVPSKGKIKVKDGFSVYTDKDGVEYKILNTEIDPIYLSKIVKDFDKKDIEKELKQLDEIYPWTITTGQPFKASSFYIETEPKTKNQIAKELESLKSREKETKKRIKELEKQQKKLK